MCFEVFSGVGEVAGAFRTLNTIYMFIIVAIALLFTCCCSLPDQLLQHNS